MTNFNHSLAVLVGIDAYANGIPWLTTAVNDATRLADLLRAEHDYETLLLTEPAIGQPITSARLAALFTEELPARLGEDDRLLVYFAGHGVALDGDDGPAGYLVPQDARPDDSASMLAMTDLHAWLSALPCRHMLAILDCCFAGAFRWASTRHVGALPDVIHQERYDRYLLSPAWQVLTSAAYDQKALDVLGGNVLGRREADGQHSPFALALIAALEKGEADLVPRGQGDGVITATELYLYLREQVEVQAEAQVGHQQTPGLWPLKKHRKGEFIFLAPGHALNLPPAPELTGEANPYRGLKSYDQRHTQLFFGREDEIRELAALVDRQPFVAVLGASGTGKSSLVKAGLLPRLQQACGDDSSRRRPPGATEVATTISRVLAPMRPTDQPLQALAALLRTELDADPSGFGNPKGLAQDDHVLAKSVASWAQAHPGQRMVLTIDQFEELATLCRYDGERERFLRILAAAVQEQPDAFRLIITLRTDFEPQFTQQGAPLTELWPASRYVVPPMDIEDLRQVIEGPASVRVLYFEPPELVDDLIKEVVQTPGALPLLSFTLSELYVKYVQSGRDDRALSGADYQALGGVIGSLRNRASEEYDALPDDAHCAAMQRVMLRMVAVEGGELARRRVALSELEYPTEEDNARVRTVLDRLVDARLLVRGTSENPDGAQGEAYVEPAHDALVLAWDKLLRWKKEAEEYLPLQRRLAQAAMEWSKATPEGKSGLLWNDDPRLPQVEELFQPTVGRFGWAWRMLAPQTDAPPDTTWLNGTELAFVQKSIQARARFWRRVLGAATLLALVVVTAAVVSLALRDRAVKAEATALAEATRALNAEGTAVAEATRALNAEATAVANEQMAREKQAEAEREARRSQAGELAAHAQNAIVNNKYDPSLALMLAMEAVEVTWQAPENIVTTNADDALRNAIGAAPPWRQTLPASRHTAAVNSVAFSPDGTAFLTASDDRTIRLWDVATTRQLQVFVGHTASVNSAAFSPDGKTIVTSSSDGTARIWVSATGLELLRLTDHMRDVWSATYSPDGLTIYTSGCDSEQAGECIEGSVHIWDAISGQHVRQLANHPDAIVSTAVSPDAKTILTAGCDKPDNRAYSCSVTRIWDAMTGRELRRLKADTGHVYSAVFSSDGKTILTASDDNTARIWDTASGDEIQRLEGHNHDVYSAMFSSDGHTIITASDDGTARLWDTATGQELRQLGELYRATFVKSAAISPNGQTIVTAGCSISNRNFRCLGGNLQVWNASSEWTSRALGGHSGAVNYIAFDPSGNRIVTAGVDSTARIWDVKTGQEVFQLSGLRTVNSAVFSPDGKIIATTSFPDSYSVRLWDAANGLELRRLEGSGGSYGNVALFSPDGQFIVTGGENRKSLVLSVATGEVVQSFLGSSAVFSPDGNIIATETPEGTMLWDVASGEELRQFQGHSTAFSPDGKMIFTAKGQAFYLWNTSTGEEITQLQSETGEVVSAVFSPKGDTLITVSGCDIRGPYGCEAASARIWDISDKQEIERLRGGKGSMSYTAFSPDGKVIATAHEDGTARLWEASSSEDVSLVQTISRDLEITLHSPDGTIILKSVCIAILPSGNCREGTARLLDANNGKELSTLDGHFAAFSPDGELVVTTQCDVFNREQYRCIAGTARIWDTASGKELRVLHGHTAAITSAAFSRDGKIIVTVDEDGVTRQWLARVEDMIARAQSLIQRDPPLLTPEERVRYGLE